MKHHPQGPEVIWLGAATALDKTWRHVERRPCDAVTLAAPPQRASKAEVRHLAVASVRTRGCTLARQHHVLQLQVAVHEALLVHVSHALEGLIEEPSFHRAGQTLHAIQVAARASLHKQRRLTVTWPFCSSEGLDHIGVVQTHHQVGLCVGLLCALLNFYGDHALVASEFGDIDLSEGTAPNVGALLSKSGSPGHGTECALRDHLFRRFHARCRIHLHETTASEKVVVLRILNEFGEVFAESCQL
mmetsp:Transcript_119442/g.254872  ORF Transcript_119442/g.254872 Transcript_119442/m.254872 type:complete len:245 (-) Transcript_119442:230-964(-)